MRFKCNVLVEMKITEFILPKIDLNLTNQTLYQLHTSQKT